MTTQLPSMGDDWMDVQTGHVSLAALLVQERTLLARYRFAHAQLRVLVEAGETRFYGWAIDELTDIESTLETVEAARRGLVAGLGDATDASLHELVTAGPDELREVFERLADEIDDLLEQVNDERVRTRRLVHLSDRHPRRRP